MKEYRVIRLYAEELKKDKRIYVYLPANYNKSDDFYPVLYMHDGHNLFDDVTAYSESWRIMELYEANPSLPKLIIVGIEQSDDRSDELIPYPFKYFDGEKAGGKADLYLRFLMGQVKPYIDKTFRTFKSPKHTALMGSSFGGVNTLYAALEYEPYFSRYACVSNAYLFDGFTSKMDTLLQKKKFKSLNKLYLDVGTKEHDDPNVQQAYIDKNMALADTLKQKLSRDQFQFKIIDGGIHHERAWSKRFKDIIEFLFND